MTDTAVTMGQVQQIRKMAKDKGIHRDVFQAALDNGTVGRCLDGIRDDLLITVGTPLVPPLGGRIHTVKVCKLQLDREWEEAINRVGPNTGANWNVREVGDLCPPSGTGVVKEEEHILLNYPIGGGGWDKALAWATQSKLIPNDPRRVFAMAEKRSTLHSDFGTRVVFVVSPIAYGFDGDWQACYAWWEEPQRGADLRSTADFGHTFVWFSFRK